MMIPKVIHYCWFGQGPKPALANKCIESWKRYMPEYEIVEWNESNYDISKCIYTQEAYKEKKWAFVSDYARFDILNRYGGVYFDTDVELIRPLDDIIQSGAFFGIEKGSGEESRLSVAVGLGMGTPPKNQIYQEVLNEYSRRHFLSENGIVDKTTVVDFVTNILEKRGFHSDREWEKQKQKVDGITIYPSEYFCPMDYLTGKVDITENTRTIHHYMASWESVASRQLSRLRRKQENSRGVGKIMYRLFAIPYQIINKLEQKGLAGTVKYTIVFLKTKINKTFGGGTS